MKLPNNLGENISIAILDSGVDIERSEFTDININLINDCTDKIGHGTAVTALISKIVPRSKIFCFNIFENKDDITAKELSEILNDLSCKNHYDIIHLSCGITSNEYIDELYSICNKITETGTIIVSAFDNEGAISYPATFNNVIGVDWDIHCADGYSYFFLEGSKINIKGTGSLQRLPWLNKTYRYVAGSSFAAPYITGIISKLLSSGIEPCNINNALKNHSQKVLTIDNTNYLPQSQDIKIENAIVLPYNKEIQTLSIFEDMLAFKIKDIFDFPIFRNIGKQCQEVTGVSGSQRLIKSVNEISWESDFDTVILGHLNLASEALKKDFTKEFLNKCIIHKKNVYSFDDLRPYQNLVEQIQQNQNFAFYPRIDDKEIDKSLSGKLFRFSTPILSIFGTSSKQGKFSLQLALRKNLQQKGYKVGGLGTEPSSLLFGLNRVYPMGFESIKLNGYNSIIVLNRFFHEIDIMGYDIIITGAQSHTVPHNSGNIGHYPLSQHELFISSEPDAAILCINPFDEIKYVKRTIMYLESYMNTKVISLVMFPVHKDRTWSIMGANSCVIRKDILFNRKNFYQQNTGIPCFVNDFADELDLITNKVIDFFAE